MIPELARARGLAWAAPVTGRVTQRNETAVAVTDGVTLSELVAAKKRIAELELEIAGLRSGGPKTASAAERMKAYRARKRSS